MFSLGMTSAAYIAAAVLFILSLGGLSNQESAKRAVWYGIAGMAVAVIATVFGPGVYNVWLILIAIAAGAFAGQYVAARVQMTEMPQLVAALHSFVGLAAVFIGLNADIMLSSVVELKASGLDERLAMRRIGPGSQAGSGRNSRQDKCCKNGLHGHQPSFFRRGRCATTFSIIRMPASPPSVMIDSGWNWTAATGSLSCSIAITIPSSVSAVTANSSGKRTGSAKIEW